MRLALRLQAATFLLLLVAVVTGGLVLHDYAHHIGTVANNAATAAKTATAAGKTAATTAKHLATSNAAAHDLRSEQLAALHAQAVTYCGDIHGLVDVFERYLERAITAPQLTIPDLTPDQKKALSKVGVKSVAAQKALLADLKAHDCMSVKPLPTATKQAG